MGLISKAARGLKFAHLAKARAEGDEQDDDEKSARRAEGDDPKDDDEDGGKDKAKKARRAEGDDRDERAEGDDRDERAEGDDNGEDETGQQTNARAEGDEKDDDEDPDHEMRGKSAAAVARRRERARCAAIFASKAAGRNPALAASLAFETTMSRREALAVLNTAGAAAQPVHSDRAARNPNLGTGLERAPSSHQAVASSWDRAMASVRRR